MRTDITHQWSVVSVINAVMLSLSKHGAGMLPPFDKLRVTARACIIAVVCCLSSVVYSQNTPTFPKPNYLGMHLIEQPDQPVTGIEYGTIFYDQVDSLLKIMNPNGTIDTFCINCTSSGISGNIFGIEFVTVDSQLIYNAAAVGTNLTGKTLHLVHVAGSECYQQGNVSINGTGGVTFTFNPGVNFCFIEYD